MSDFGFEIPLNRKTYTLWTIPAEFKRKHKIVDGQHYRFEICLGGLGSGLQSCNVMCPPIGKTRREGHQWCQACNFATTVTIAQLQA